MNSPETILQFGLSDTEKRLVKRLISSFEIETVSLTIQTVRNFVLDSTEKRICLVLFRIPEDQPKQDRVVQLIRDFVGPLTPILILVPKEKRGEIRKYLRAGADDFIELPLNRNQFSISFLILLEMGQVITAQQRRQARQVGGSADEVTPWNKMVNYFQEGVSYFAPKSLISSNRTEHIFDRWEQQQRLGIGGFGVVWLVKEITTGRLAVAKTPHSPEMNIRVLRSAAILKRLVYHPNIVHLLEIVKDHGRLILIQEYVDGPTLQQLLEEGIAPLDRETYFLQLLSVVAYAHQNKILHRDIKPENILINGRGQLKLLDFGIARDLSWQSAGNSSEGTVNFMPPEQYAGRSCLASDVWALGVILYIFATNEAPYDQQNDDYPMDIDTIVTSRTPDRVNPEINPELNGIIVKCLQRELRYRYKNGIELQLDMQQKLPEFGSGKLLQDFSTVR